MEDKIKRIDQMNLYQIFENIKSLSPKCELSGKCDDDPCVYRLTLKAQDLTKSLKSQLENAEKRESELVEWIGNKLRRNYTRGGGLDPWTLQQQLDKKIQELKEKYK